MSKNDITGDEIKTKVAVNNAYEENFDTVFGKSKETKLTEAEKKALQRLANETDCV